MAIARTALGNVDPRALVEMWKSVALELKERATQRLVRDARKLTSSAKRARLLMRDVARILEELDAETAAWIAENIPKSYLRGVKTANVGLSEIGATVPEGGLVPAVHREAIQVLVNDMQDDLLAATEGIERNIRRLVRRTQLTEALDKLTTQRVAKGIAQGQRVREISRGIKRDLIDELGSRFRVGKKMVGIDDYSELVALTKSSEAVSAGTQNRVLEAGHDLVMIVGSNSENPCTAYVGKVFSISGTHPDYPAVSELPGGIPGPFHPRCTKRPVPFIEELATGAEKRRGLTRDPGTLNRSFQDLTKSYRRNKLDGIAMLRRINQRRDWELVGAA